MQNAEGVVIRVEHQRLDELAHRKRGAHDAVRPVVPAVGRHDAARVERYGTGLYQLAQHVGGIGRLKGARPIHHGIGTVGHARTRHRIEKHQTQAAHRLDGGDGGADRSRRIRGKRGRARCMRAPFEGKRGKLGRSGNRGQVEMRQTRRRASGGLFLFCHRLHLCRAACAERRRTVCERARSAGLRPGRAPRRKTHAGERRESQRAHKSAPAHTARAVRLPTAQRAHASDPMGSHGASTRGSSASNAARSSSVRYFLSTTTW